MADSNRASLAYVVETMFGAVPSGPPVLKNLRMTGETLKQDTTTVTSQEIRSSRDIVDVLRTGIQGSGDINFELSYGSYDDFYQYLLLSSGWSSIVTTTAVTTISAASGDNSINRSSGSFVSDGFVANQWIKIAGFTVATGNNTIAKIVSVVALKMVLSHITLVTQAAGDSITVIMGEQIVNGTTLKSLSIERTYNDLTNVFAKFHGMCIETGQCSTTKDGIITGSFGFLGKKELSGTATIGSGSNTAVNTNAVCSAVDNALFIHENGSSYDVTSINHSINNNLRTRQIVGTLGAISVGTGTVNCTGAHSAYMADRTVMDKYLGFTKTSVAYAVRDNDGNILVYDFPRTRYTAGQASAQGINQDIMADMSWTAYRHESEGVTVRITRFAA